MAVQVRTLELYDDLGIVKEALDKGLFMSGFTGFLGAEKEVRFLFVSLTFNYSLCSSSFLLAEHDV